MKKFILTLSIVLAGVFAACSPETNQIFDKSSSQRINEALKTYKETLCSASNGWVMQYFPYAGADNSSHPNYGGFNFLVRFTADGHVVVASEDFDAAASATSTYRLVQSEGVLLSFDTYNDIFHFYSDPKNPAGIGVNGTGLEGDFEFRVKSATTSKVVMEGKKHNSRIEMTPLPASTSWKDYLTAIQDMQEEIAFASYTFNVQDSVMNAARGSNVITISYLDDEGSPVDEVLPFVVTPEGLTLYDTLRVYGCEVREFTYAKDGSFKIVAKNDPSVYFKGVVKPFNEVLVSGDAIWYITYDNLGSTGKAAMDNVSASVVPEGEVINFLYFYSNCFRFQSGIYWGGFLYSYDNSVEGKISFKVTGTGGPGSADQGNANYYMNLPGFSDIISFINGKTFNISGNDARNPTVLTLVDVADPNNVIVCTNNQTKVYSN